VFVQAGLPDGSVGLFLVDTGADVSVLTDATAARLGLSDGERIPVWGLSGGAYAVSAELPYVDLGGFVVRGITVVSGVPGVSDTAGFMPVDGLLGNNVWGRFVLELDYPADKMVLHAPDSVKRPKQSTPLVFDAAHIHAPIEITLADGRGTERLLAQVDTGASDLTLCARTGAPFASNYTEGVEAVRGIGASETLPPYRFLQTTRRIPVQSVRIGGAEVGRHLPIRWLEFENTTGFTCGAGGMKALLGHEYLADHRVWFDYHDEWIALTPSHRRERQLDGHEVLYRQELAAHGRDPTRALLRAKLLIGQGEIEDATKELRNVAGTDEEKAEARVLLAAVLRSEGKLSEAWDAIGSMSAGELVDQDQIVGSVNGLSFDGRSDEALDLAARATTERPDNGWSWVALADAELHVGEVDDASQALLEAARLEAYPDAHLLRRARVALAAGDRYGAIAHVRKLLKLYPGGGTVLWFYAMLLESDADKEMFRADLDAAMARLHPDMRPFDFLVASHHILGDEDDVKRMFDVGKRAHCDPMPPSPEHDNCMAWYEALAHVDLDDALRRIDSALEKSGDRPDFLDTKAMVHLARGESESAVASALEAARLSPDDVYMVWQAERIAEIAGGGEGS
jgi:tetratricopeptide (TPR) repeat protein